MSLDLTLLVSDPRFKDATNSPIRIEFGTNMQSFEQFEKYLDEKAEPVCEDFHAFASTIPDGSMEGESCYGNVTDSPYYGKKIVQITASEFLKFWENYNKDFWSVHYKDSVRQRAAIAFIRELDSDTPIAILWN